LENIRNHQTKNGQHDAQRLKETGTHPKITDLVRERKIYNFTVFCLSAPLEKNKHAPPH